jgi:hypothetical protein
VEVSEGEVDMCHSGDIQILWLATIARPS